MIKIFKKIKDKIKEIKLKRDVKKLFPELPANNWVDKLDESEYNIKYVMNQKTFDKLKLVVSDEALEAYDTTVVPNSLVQYGEVIEIYFPKDKSEKTAYGELTYLQKRG